MTINISSEAQAQLEVAAGRAGQTPEEYAHKAFRIWLSLVASAPESEETAFQDMKALSIPALENY